MGAENHGRTLLARRFDRYESTQERAHLTKLPPWDRLRLPYAAWHIRPVQSLFVMLGNNVEMTPACRWTRTLALGAAMIACAPSAVLAQSAEPFFKGKVINLYIGFAPGGTYDYFGRLVGRFIGKHIPGNPTVVAQTMQGAGSLQAANFLFAQAPKDGTAWGVVTQTLALEEALRSPGAHYKAAEFTWLGRMTSIVEVHFTWKTSNTKTIQDARQYETPVAGTGAGSPSEGYPKLLNALAGTKFKIISGYPGSTQGMLAMERGEVDGGLTSWNTLKRTKQEWIQNKDINVLVQYALERHRELPDVPTLLDAVNTPEARAIMAFYVSGGEVGRSLLAPPGIPADRVNVLRAAFGSMLKDPEFLAE
ncbi:MAG: Bug family tripartite tricarboxylate transporter substrate binding protein, partial [Xanthobacteraceae bacterium]